MSGTVRAVVGDGRLVLQQGDVTRVAADAIVNAANSELRGGGGVDGAIHRVGGASVMAECRRIGGCPTGSAVVTSAGDLPCRWVIHAVGPVWRGGNNGEAELLASTYAESFARAREIGARSVALPSLSTGAYGYPIEGAAPIAIRAAIKSLTGGAVEEARFVLFGPDALAAFVDAAAGAVES